MARNRCILATGHLHANEVMKLVPLALDMGIHRVILTHPHYSSIKLSDEAQKHLSRRPEVFIEHCFAVHTQDGVPLRSYAEAIRVTGPEQVLLSTDFGQLSSDPFPDGTIRYAAELGELVRGRCPVPASSPCSAPTGAALWVWIDLETPKYDRPP